MANFVHSSPTACILWIIAAETGRVQQSVQTIRTYYRFMTGGSEQWVGETPLKKGDIQDDACDKRDSSVKQRLVGVNGLSQI